MTGSFSRSKLTLTLFILSASFGVFYSISESPRESGILSPVVSGTTISQEAPPKSRFDFLTRFLLPKKFDSSPPSGTVLGEKTGEESSPVTKLSTQVNMPTPTSTPVPLNSDAAPTVTPTPTPSDASSGTAPTSVPLTPNQNLVVAGSNEVINLLVSRNFQKLYDLMSLEFKSVFSREDFVSSFSSSTDVNSGKLIEVPKVYGGNSEWGEQLTELSLNDGTVKKYLLIFHRESNIWKLYGTEDK